MKKPHEQNHVGSGQPSGSSHDRRKARRIALYELRQRCPEGTPIKITTDTYGKRYKGTTAHILEVLDGKFRVQAYRRKAPLVVAVEHVQEVA